MSITASAASGTQNLTSLILQQLLSGSNAQATSALSPTLLKNVLTSAHAAQSAQAPASVTQALGNLLSGQGQASAQSDLSQLQSYFKENPDSLASLLTSLQGGAATYTASGTVGGGSSLLAALGLGTGSSSSASSTSSLINLLLGDSSQDPLVAALGGTSASSSGSFSLLG
jgi:hypothetical protein